MSNNHKGGFGSNVLSLNTSSTSDGNTFQTEFLDAYKNIKAEADGKVRKAKKVTTWKKGGQCFVAIRRILGLTQESFSELIGISKTGLSNWETGIFRPRFHTLVSIKYSLDDLGKKIGKPGIADLIVVEDFGYTKRGEPLNL